MDAQAAIKLDEIRKAVRELRQIHHRKRHPHTPTCAECVCLSWLKDEGF